MSDSSKQRNDFMNEMENISKKERFGLFTQPLPLSVNDDSLSRRPYCILFDKNIINFIKAAQIPKNFSTCPPKKGKINDALFMNPGYVTINDFYKDPFKSKQLNIKEKFDKIPYEKPFKMTHNEKKIIEPPFEYLSDPQIKEYKNRDNNGKVITGPKNIVTNEMKKGATYGHLFGKYNYCVDPYENRKYSDLQELIDHRKRLLSGKPFCSNSHGRQTFTPDIETYNNSDYNFYKKSRNLKYLLHPYPFRPNNPSKKGYNKTFERFPMYMEEQLFAKKNIKEKNDKKAWIPNYNGTLSKPSPAIISRIMSARTKCF